MKYDLQFPFYFSKSQIRFYRVYFIKFFFQVGIFVNRLFSNNLIFDLKCLNYNFLHPLVPTEIRKTLFPDKTVDGPPGRQIDYCDPWEIYCNPFTVSISAICVTLHNYLRRYANGNLSKRVNVWNKGKKNHNGTESRHMFPLHWSFTQFKIIDWFM